MQSNELWAAWIVAGVLVAVAAGVGHLAGTGHSHRVSEAPMIAAGAPPAAAGPVRPQVFLCVVEGPQQGQC